MFKKILVVILTLFSLPLVNAKTLLVVGDSISAGFGIEQGKGWVNLLEQRLQHEKYNVQVINASISGDTTTNGLVRLPALLTEHKPAIVIIELGGNDGLRGTPPKQIKQNLAQMVSLVKKNNCQVLLVGIQLPPNYGQQYLERFLAIYPEVAKAQGVALLPSIVANIGGKADLMQADGIHPNSSGQAILLENVWAELQPLLNK